MGNERGIAAVGGLNRSFRTETRAPGRLSQQPHLPAGHQFQCVSRHHVRRQRHYGASRSLPGGARLGCLHWVRQSEGRCTVKRSAGGVADASAEADAYPDAEADPEADPEADTEADTEA